MAPKGKNEKSSQATNRESRRGSRADNSQQSPSPTSSRRSSLVDIFKRRTSQPDTGIYDPNAQRRPSVPENRSGDSAPIFTNPFSRRGSKAIIETSPPEDSDRKGPLKWEKATEDDPKDLVDAKSTISRIYKELETKKLNTKDRKNYHVYYAHNGSEIKIQVSRIPMEDYQAIENNVLCATSGTKGRDNLDKTCSLLKASLEKWSEA